MLTWKRLSEPALKAEPQAGVGVFRALGRLPQRMDDDVQLGVS
jgi:hypothetical protein